VARLYIEGMLGLGDNIFARPFIRAQMAHYESVKLRTSWPELFEDIPGLKFIRPSTRLRTQLKNVLRRDARESSWSLPPMPGDGTQTRRVSYGHHSLLARGITRSIEATLPLRGAPYNLDLPDFRAFEPGFAARPGKALSGEKPLAVVRPVTVRSEWRNEARNPLPEYVAKLAGALMDTHTVVSVADLADGAEWLVGEAPPAHVRYHKGELDVRGLLGLVQSANIVIGGVGWIVPAGIASGVKTFVIHGGHALHNAPHVITDPRMNLANYGFALPPNFHQCHKMLCPSCDKTIPNFAAQWNRFALRHSLPEL
jgi:hypothetical protein